MSFRNYNPVERRTKLGKERSLKGFNKNSKSLQANNSHNSGLGDVMGVNKISGTKQGKTNAPAIGANFTGEIQNLTKEITELKLSVDHLENERDFYFTKLHDIEILCQNPELENLPMLLEIKKILYAADAKESALAEAEEAVGQSVDVEGVIDHDDITDY